MAKATMRKSGRMMVTIKVAHHMDADSMAYAAALYLLRFGGNEANLPHYGKAGFLRATRHIYSAYGHPEMWPELDEDEWQWIDVAKARLRKVWPELFETDT